MTTHRKVLMEYISHYNKPSGTSLSDEESLLYLDSDYDLYGEWLVQNTLKSGKESVTFFAIDNISGEMVGNVNVRLSGKQAEEYGNIGYMVRPDLRGRGIGKTLVSLLISLLTMMGLDTICAVVQSDNEASRRALLANDFKPADNIQNKADRVRYIYRSDNNTV